MELRISTDDRLELIRRDTSEVLNEDVLRRLMETETPIRHYIGLEISGRIHLGTGLMAMGKVRDFLEAGVDCTVFLADWHSWINDKLGADMDLIRTVARDYFGMGLAQCIGLLGGDPSRVHFVLGSALYEGDPLYWPTVMDVAKQTSLNRILRSVTILGRREGETMDFAKLLYPAMQAADIFALGVNLAHAGSDQRKAHVIAIDAALQMHHHRLLGPDGAPIKPAVVHHPLIVGLGAPPRAAAGEERDLAIKMSKSNPMSAVFVDDSPDEIREKIRRAYCPPAVAEDNPLLNWAQHLLFGAMRSSLEVQRKPEHGGLVTFATYQELVTSYVAGELHPADLKAGIANWLIEILAGVRTALTTGSAAEVRRSLDAGVTR